MPTDAYDAPFTALPGRDPSCLVLCDHASNSIPPEYDGLGLSAAELGRHIAWDEGARGVALALADRFGCPAVLGGVSRLLVDFNRGPDDPTLILTESDGVTVPGNQAVDAQERSRRLERFHQPYHAYIDAHLDRLLALGVRPMVVSIHSFTTEMDGVQRPWPIGLLWKDPRAPMKELIDWFAQRTPPVGDNQPYDARCMMGWSLDRHALRRGLPNVLFEIRRDGIRTPSGQKTWGGMVHDALRETGFAQAHADACRSV